jgi:hypothetical protein
MRIPKTAMACSPLFLCLTMGATDCQYFSTTTVPAADTTVPVTWDAVWVGGNYVNLIPNTGSFIYHIAPGTSVIALSAGMDSGGVSKVSMAGWERWVCCSGNICSLSEPLSVPIVATQDGSVGATVSDGVYTGRFVSVPTRACNAGYTLESYSFTWMTTAEDFFGNKTSGARQTIVYP